MKLKTKRYGTVRIEYYIGLGKEPVHNWKVYAGCIHIGYLHMCDGIGGNVGDENFMESEDFYKLCCLAEQDMLEKEGILWVDKNGIKLYD